MEYGLLWIGGAVVVAIFANGRGRSGGGWFFLSLLISPLLAGLLVLVLPTKGITYDQIVAMAAVEGLPPDSQARRLLQAKMPKPPVRYVNRWSTPEEIAEARASNRMRDGLPPTSADANAERKPVGFVEAAGKTIAFVAALFCAIAIGAIVLAFVSGNVIS